MSRVTQQDLDEYFELISSGMSQRKAALVLGIPRTTLQHHLKKLADQVEDGVGCGAEQATVNTSKTQPVILYFDLECSPTSAYIWRRFKENISQAQILNEWYLLTQSWAFNDGEIQSSKLTSQEAIDQNDESLVLQVWHLLNNADIVVGHNLRRFDIKKINARFAYYRLPPPSPYKIIDTLEICKSKFAFPSNKLNDVCAYLGIGVKEDTGGFSTWAKCVKGDDSALEHMEIYNQQDVRLTRELYKRLRSFDNNSVNVSVMVDQTGMICSSCASDDVEVLDGKFVHTPNGKYQAYKCNSCNTTLRHTTKTGKSNQLVRVVT